MRFPVVGGIAERILGRRLPTTTITSEAATRWDTLWRRYFPVALGMSCLGMVVGFFPSTLPAATQLALPPPAPTQTAAGGGAQGAATLPSVPLAGLLGPDALFAGGPPQDTITPILSEDSVGTAGATPEQPSPAGPSAASCPLAFPATGTPLDSVTSELASLCLTALAQLGSGGGAPGVPGLPTGAPSPPTGVPSAPTGLSSLPGGAPGLPSGGVPAPATAKAGTAMPPMWIAVDRAVSATVAPTVVLGLLQGASVPASTDEALARLRAAGSSVTILLVPAASDTSMATFPDWASRTAAALPHAATFAVVLGAVATNATTPLATAAASALSAIAEAAPGAPVGLWWADGGTATADGGLWNALGRAAHSAAPAFVAASSNQRCPDVATIRRSAVAAGLGAAAVLVEQLPPARPPVPCGPVTGAVELVRVPL